MKLECICCKGTGYVMVVDASFPADPARREGCCYCATKGDVKLTVSEAVTYTRGQEPDEFQTDARRLS